MADTLAPFFEVRLVTPLPIFALFSDPPISPIVAAVETLPMYPPLLRVVLLSGGWDLVYLISSPLSHTVHLMNPSLDLFQIVSSVTFRRPPILF